MASQSGNNAGGPTVTFETTADGGKEARCFFGQEKSALPHTVILKVVGDDLQVAKYLDPILKVLKKAPSKVKAIEYRQHPNYEQSALNFFALLWDEHLGDSESGSIDIHLENVTPLQLFCISDTLLFQHLRSVALRVPIEKDSSTGVSPALLWALQEVENKASSLQELRIEARRKLVEREDDIRKRIEKKILRSSEQATMKVRTAG